MNCNWNEFYYGRCYGCGNSYNKDDWKSQRYLYENNYDYDFNLIIDYFINEGFNFEGNGVCFSCSSNLIADLKTDKIIL